MGIIDGINKFIDTRLEVAADKASRKEQKSAAKGSRFNGSGQAVCGNCNQVMMSVSGGLWYKCGCRDVLVGKEYIGK